MRSRVSVLGLGNWGTALAQHLASKGIGVLGWCKNPEMAASINERHRNDYYLSGVQLSPNLTATTSLDEAAQREVLVLAFPSTALQEVLSRLPKQGSKILVSAIKGLERESLQTPLDYAATVLESSDGVALSGPSFARDVVAQRPCGVVAASRSEEAAKRVAEIFSSESMRVYTSSDALGVELGGVVKNIVALAAGVVDGLGLGDSARAGLITRGLAEMMRLAQAMGAEVLTLSGLSGLGDLIMTATCDQSRNRTVGLRLGRGEKLDAILASLGSVAEGVTTTPLVRRLSERHGVEMPITAHVEKLLAGQVSAQEMVKSLLARPLRKEFDR